MTGRLSPASLIWRLMAIAFFWAVHYLSQGKGHWLKIFPHTHRAGCHVTAWANWSTGQCSAGCNALGYIHFASLALWKPQTRNCASLVLRVMRMLSTDSSAALLRRCLRVVAGNVAVTLVSALVVTTFMEIASTSWWLIHIITIWGPFPVSLISHPFGAILTQSWNNSCGLTCLSDDWVVNKLGAECIEEVVSYSPADCALTSSNANRYRSQPR